MSNLPMSLVRERIKEASTRVQQVAASLSEPNFDKNVATVKLNIALGILDTLMDGDKPKQQTKGTN